jgi:hypothetical protein
VKRRTSDLLSSGLIAAITNLSIFCSKERYGFGSLYEASTPIPCLHAQKHAMRASVRMQCSS